MQYADMARRKLTEEERKFTRIGAGTPFSRWWPVALVLIGVLFAMFSPQFVANCTGVSLEQRGGRQTATVAFLLAYPCSPYLLREGFFECLTFVLLWAPLPLAFINWRWSRRHQRFWDGERLKDAERRKAKHQTKPPESQ